MLERRRPKDTKHYRGGVWALPPTYANGEKDRARYGAIGESDRFTLKFVKPREPGLAQRVSWP
jgi:predicted methyltransferase